MSWLTTTIPSQELSASALRISQVAIGTVAPGLQGQPDCCGHGGSVPSLESESWTTLSLFLGKFSVVVGLIATPKYLTKGT